VTADSKLKLGATWRQFGAGSLGPAVCWQFGSSLGATRAKLGGNIVHA